MYVLCRLVGSPKDPEVAAVTYEGPNIPLGIPYGINCGLRLDFAGYPKVSEFVAHMLRADKAHNVGLPFERVVVYKSLDEVFGLDNRSFESPLFDKYARIDTGTLKILLLNVASGRFFEMALGVPEWAESCELGENPWIADNL